MPAPTHTDNTPAQNGPGHGTTSDTPVSQPYARSLQPHGRRGSRSSSCPKSAQIWSSFSNLWSRRQVPIHLRHCYRDDSPVPSSPRWPQPPDEATRPPGQDGTTCATPPTIRPSSTERPNLSRASSSSSPASCSTIPPHPTAAHRSSPRSVLSIGVIRPISATRSACPHVIASPLAAWLALGPQPASLRQ